MYKTRVHNVNGVWRVDYYMPYSGFLCVDFVRWEDAMLEACSVESYKHFVS